METTSRAHSLANEDLEHILHPVTSHVDLRRDGPLIFAEGRGIYLKDVQGREYIDGMSGLWNVNIGHGRQEILRAIVEQMQTLEYAPSFWGYSNPPAIHLAQKLATLTPPGLEHFFFTNGGSESNETAFKFARHYGRLQGKPDKHKIIARTFSYHGVSFGALSATGIEAYWRNYGPLTPGFLHVPAPYCYRCELRRTYPDCGVACAQAVAERIKAEDPDTVAAVIAEPVQGVGGVLVPPPEYLPMLSQICRELGVLLIADEVITGFGRTGTMFAVEHWNVRPDIMTVAKGITSGYLPMGAAVVSSEVFRAIAGVQSPLMHGFTNNGHPTCSAAALANLDLMVAEDLPGNAARAGRRLLDHLNELRDHPAVGEVRGIGLMAAVEVVADKATRARFPADKQAALRIAQACRAEGLICRAAFENLMLAPPLSITDSEVDDLFARFKRGLESVDLT